MDNKLHVLSKNGAFLFRFNDGEFGSKWCGLWKKSTKYFDYFAFKINGEYLNPGNLKSFDFYNSQLARHTFSCKNLTITEDVVCLDDAIIITIKSDLNFRLDVEVGVNIRDRSENYTKGKRYALSQENKKLSVSYGAKTAYIIFDTGSFTKNEYYGIHSPGQYSIEKGFSKYLDDGSIENKYVPGTIVADIPKNGEFNLILSIRDLDNESIHKIIKNSVFSVKQYEEIINSVCNYYGDINLINKNFLKDILDATYSYANLIEKEIYAGFPYFNEFWTRDALLVLPSFLSLNNPIFVKDILKKIAYNSGNIGIPNVFESNLKPLDAPALFLITLHEYFMWTNDKAILLELADFIRGLIKNGLSYLENGLIHDNGRASWMDSIDREYSIEVQALWEKALKDGVDILNFLEDDTSDLIAIARNLHIRFSAYKRGSYFSDQLGKDINSGNQIIPAFLKIIENDDAKIILKNAEEKLLSEFGVLSVAKDDPTYNFNGYQNGAIWPLLTAMLAGAAYWYGNENLGKKCLSILREKNLSAQCSSRINEIFQPDGIPKGCPSQAWSIGLIPQILDKHVLGIGMDAPHRMIKIRAPIKGIKVERILFVENQEIKLSFLDGAVFSNKAITESEDGFIISF